MCPEQTTSEPRTAIVCHEQAESNPRTVVVYPEQTASEPRTVAEFPEQEASDPRTIIIRPQQSNLQPWQHTTFLSKAKEIFKTFGTPQQSTSSDTTVDFSSDRRGHTSDPSTSKAASQLTAVNTPQQVGDTKIASQNNDDSNRGYRQFLISDQQSRAGDAAAADGADDDADGDDDDADGDDDDSDTDCYEFLDDVDESENNVCEPKFDVDTNNKSASVSRRDDVNSVVDETAAQAEHSVSRVTSDRKNVTVRFTTTSTDPSTIINRGSSTLSQRQFSKLLTSKLLKQSRRRFIKSRTPGGGGGGRNASSRHSSETSSSSSSSLGLNRKANDERTKKQCDTVRTTHLASGNEGTVAADIDASCSSQSTPIAPEVNSHSKQYHEFDVDSNGFLALTDDEDDDEDMSVDEESAHITT